MKKLFILLLLISSNLMAHDQNVIFITWDGVRHEEFFGRKNDPTISSEPAEMLNIFWSELSQEGIVLGENKTMTVANDSNISYPAYLSMMSGVFTDYCHLNQPTAECRRNPFETLPERVLREKNLDRSKVAVFASWDRIKDASESVENGIVTSAGPVEFTDPNFPGAHDEINKRMRGVMAPWHYQSGERPDEFTFAHAMTYLKNNRPKFLWIYFVESDEYAHGNRYRDYVRSLNTYDSWLKEIIVALKSMGKYGENTSIVLTTDHGRGKGSNWMHHGTDHENSQYVWAYIRGPVTPSLGKISGTKYSHLNLRPTMELMMGLEPMNGEKNIIKEAFWAKTH